MKYLKENKVYLLFFFMGVLFLINNWSIVLWNQDEAAYAGFAKTMLESKDFLIPDFIWSDAHRKTPLHFWFIVINFYLFGFNEFACRLSSSIFVFASIVLLYHQAKYFFTKEVGFWAAAILATNFFVPALAKVALTDGTLLFFSSLAGFSIMHLMEKKSKKWLFYFWLAIASGLLLKGPQIIIFAGFFSLFVLLLHPNRKNIWRLQPWFYLPLAALPLLLWGYLAWQKDDGVFITWLIDWYILRRVSGSVYGQTGPPGYYLATFLVFFLPWLPFILKAIVQSFINVKQKKDSVLLISLWFLGGWIIYEVLSSKLPSYTLASYPALALLASVSMQKFKEDSKKTYFYITGIIQSVLFLGLAIASWYFLGKYLEGTGQLSLFTVFAILCSGSILFVFYCKTNHLFKAKSSLLIASMLAALVAWTWVIQDAQKLFSGSKEVALFMEGEFNKESEVNILYSFPKIPSLPFYIGRQFPNYYEDQNLDMVKENLDGQKPYIAILKKDHLDKVMTGGKKYSYHKIRSYVIDRQNFNTYYIVYNVNSQLKPGQ